MGEHWQKYEGLIVAALLAVAFAAIAFPFNEGDLGKDIIPISITYDNYYHPVIAKGIADQESQLVYPAFRALGIKNSAIADPPLHFSVPATFSKLVSLPFYQVHFFVSVLYWLWAGVALFVLVRRAFKPNTALVGLALALVPANAVWLFPLYIGFTPTFEAFFFIPFQIFLFAYLLEHRSWCASAFLGASLAAQFLTHGPFEAGLMLVFLTCAYALAWKQRREGWLARSWLLAVAVAGALSVYQYLLLRMTRITGENIVGTLLAGNPVPSYFPQIGLGWPLGIAIALGVIALGLAAASRKLSWLQGVLVAFIAFIAAFGFSTALGVDGSRAYRALYVAYPFFAVLAAAGIMAVWNQAKRFAPERLSQWFAVAVAVLIVAVSFSPLQDGLRSVASGNQAVGDRWQALQWVRDNTPEDSRVFFLLGFEHELGMLSERVPLKGDLGLGFTQRNIAELCNGQYPQNFSVHWGAGITTPIRDGAVFVPVRTGLFGIEEARVMRPGTNTPLTAEAEDRVPLSDIDYVVFQHQGTQADPCMAFFLNQSLSRGGKVAWKNNQFTVLEVAA
jgi:hypothetical protein